MKLVNNFDVLKRMGEKGLDIRLAPLGNITNLRKVKAGTQVTMGIEGNLVAALGIDNKFVGGLILADREQFDRVKMEIEAEG